MDLPAAQYRVTRTQSPAAIDEHLLLLVVEIRAERDRSPNTIPRERVSQAEPSARQFGARTRQQ